MGESVVRKFKLWFVWQEEQHQQWLEGMAREGLHLRDTNAACMHTFVRGAPADVVYRWDVRQRSDPHYQQLFRDAGWELVATTVGWHCWRKARAAGQGNEIFTDAAGEVGKYRRIMLPLAVAMLAQVPFWSHGSYWSTLEGKDNAFQGSAMLLLWAGMGATLLCLYGLTRMLVRAAALRRKEG